MGRPRKIDTAIEVKKELQTENVTPKKYIVVSGFTDVFSNKYYLTGNILADNISNDRLENMLNRNLIKEV